MDTAIKARECEGCCAALGPMDYRWNVCMECTKARHRAAMTHRCGCGRQRRESDMHKIGSRTWTTCHRCLGTVKQYS